MVKLSIIKSSLSKISMDDKKLKGILKVLLEVDDIEIMKCVIESLIEELEEKIITGDK